MALISEWMQQCGKKVLDNAGIVRDACFAVAESFIFGFRLIMLLCAGLATASAAVACRKIPAESAARVPDFGDVAAAEESRW